MAKTDKPKLVIAIIDGPIDLLKHVSNKRFMECWQEIKDKNPPFDKDTYQIEHVRQTFRKEALRRGLAREATHGSGYDGDGDGDGFPGMTS